MKPSSYRDVQLLTEVMQTPRATQRDLSKRIGIALGLTNLMIRRLAKKGYIKIANTKKSRIRYLITPQGILEKTRLTYEYIDYSLYYYRTIRTFLAERLALLAAQGFRKILLVGAGEVAEIVYLSLHETGMTFVGIIDEQSPGRRFLSYATRELSDVPALEFDRIVVTSVRGRHEIQEALVGMGVAEQKIIQLPDHLANHAPAARPEVLVQATGGS